MLVLPVLLPTVLVAACDQILGNSSATLADAGTDAALDAHARPREAESDSATPIDVGAEALDAGSYRAAVLADRPAGYWRLADPSGSPIAADETAANPGTYGRGVSPGKVTPGPIVGDPAMAPSFDGTSTIVIGDVFRFDGDGGLAPYSLEAWANLASTDAAGACFPTLLGRATTPGCGGPTEGYLLFSDCADASLRPTSARFGEDCGANAVYGSHVALDLWTYVVTTWNGSELAIYVDGKLVSNGPAQAIGSTNSTMLQIGGFGPVAAYQRGSWVGALAEVAVYDHVLSPAQICWHYDVGKGLPVNCP